MRFIPYGYTLPSRFEHLVTEGINVEIEYLNELSEAKMIYEDWPISQKEQYKVGDVVELLYFEGNERVKAASMNNHLLLTAINLAKIKLAKSKAVT